MKVAALGAMLPDGESDKIMLGAGFKYQGTKVRAALEHVRRWERALDIGAHCGLITKQLLDRFTFVEAFEPLPAHIECWEANINNPRAHLHRVAIGAAPAAVVMRPIPGLSGRSRVDPAGTVTVPMRTIDSYCFEDVGFIKVDTEGYELFVLQGAQETILFNRPAILVEQKAKLGGDYGLEDFSALRFLEGLGMAVHTEIAGDFVMVWK